MLADAQTPFAWDPLVPLKLPRSGLSLALPLGSRNVDSPQSEAARTAAFRTTFPGNVEGVVVKGVFEF